MTMQTRHTPFMCNNAALLRLTSQLYLPLLLFTLPSKQHLSFTKDFTWLSGSTPGANLGPQLFDTHPNTLVLSPFCIQEPIFVLPRVLLVANQEI